MFSGFEAWILRPLDFPDPERLVWIAEAQPKLGRGYISVSPQNYGDWRERQVSFESLGSLHRHRYNLADEGEPVRLDGAFISASLFPLLGKTPVVGRGFDRRGRPARPSRFRRAHLRPDLARAIRRFSGRHRQADPARRARSRDRRRHGAWLPFPGVGRGVDAARTRRFARASAPIAGSASTPGSRRRLRSRAPRATSRRSRAQLEAEYPQANRGFAAQVRSLRKAFVPDVVETALTASLGAALFVLLVICANVASLMLARASARGAGRPRCGRRSARAALDSRDRASPRGFSSRSRRASSERSSVFSACDPCSLTFPSSLRISSRCPSARKWASIPSLFPSWPDSSAASPPWCGGSGVRLHEALKSGERETGGGLLGRRARSALVLAEIALSTSLAAAALLMVRSFLALQAVDPGFESKDVLTAELSVAGQDLELPAERVKLAERVVTALGRIPGVEIASAASRLPASQSNEMWEVIAEGSGLEANEAVTNDGTGDRRTLFRGLGYSHSWREEPSPRPRCARVEKSSS